MLKQDSTENYEIEPLEVDGSIEPKVDPEPDPLPDRNLAKSYEEGQLKACDSIEAKFKDEPDPVKLGILASLLVVESGMAIIAGWAAGWAVLFLAPLPIALLAGSAWIVADRIDLPEKYKEMQEGYDALSK
jgi:hypothetical protein